MLTEYGMQERMWGRFPALRKALHDKRVPNEYYGPTSVSENIFNGLERLLVNSILVLKHAELVNESARAVGPKELHDDLSHLCDELFYASSFFREQAEEVRSLSYKLPPNTDELSEACS